ncbi:FAD-binding oxidoreductase [Prochlorococcus sp. MIT 1307]|uniref:FAD-binding oxidoreductase n=1 Tax=Prochlorococcus sp. MIT 1307 TaxID=3096219 RepID=UPI002A765851|nr:FAD-binding oxidoreductase [Prochlorococcus sp. MIT 1307]
MNKKLLPLDLIKELRSIAGLKVFNLSSDRERFSRDFFDYSPVLKKQLQGCCADLVVRPDSVESVLSVAGSCHRYGIPLTIRGAGTGNYGQCVPLFGGIVMLMGALRQIRDLDPGNGQVTVESGCLMGDLEKYLISQGRQLRLLPSTWRSASIGGFVAGGSGGIGSVKWGFLRDPGHLLGLEVVTVEEKPQKLQLDAKAAEALNHAYGTNGIITALTLATSQSVAWQEVTIDCETWSIAVNLINSCARAAVDLQLCSLLEEKIIEKIPHWSGPPIAQHRLLILVAPDGISTIERLAKSVGALFNLLGPENYRTGSGLRELTWNHTTLHMRALDADWTYLQMLLPQPELEAMNTLKKKWGDDLLWHLEAVRQQGVQRLAALPIVRWRGIDSLKKLMSDCREIGAVLFNPHVFTVEDGGLGVVDVDQVEMKRRFDPQGILNPGKLKGWL